MAEAVHLLAIEYILESLSSVGEFELASFMFGRPGCSIHERNLGTEVFANRRSFIRALIFVRSNGAPYLRSMSVGDLWSRVTEFLTENYWYIANDTFGQRITEAYSRVVSGTNKIALANALARSSLFVTPDVLNLFPLVTIRCEAVFECPSYYLVRSDQLTSERVWTAGRRQQINGTTGPPFADWEGRRYSVASWLAIHAALPPIARKKAACILGSLALTQIPRLRYLFSRREMHGGLCTVSNRWTYTPNVDPHTPALMNDIVVTDRDHAWLNRLAELLDSDELPARRKKRSLEYFYRAWFLDPRERFPVLCMSLDSVVGVDHGHTAAAIQYVVGLIPSIDVDRLRLLMRIRGAVIHGVAPDVYESVNYEVYYARYQADPIKDLELVVAKCLREDIFEGTLVMHADPDQQIINDMQRQGRLPQRMDDGHIIPDGL